MAIDIDKIWAENGDTTIVPEDTQPDGSVSVEQGWGSFYNLAPSDPNSKKLSRFNYNYIFNVLFTNIKEFLTFGFSKHIVGKEYSINSIVRGTDGINYRSTANSNTATPPGANWVDAFAEVEPTSLIPSGAEMYWSGTTPPAGWLEENGVSLSVASYPALFAIIGYTYGGSGANFNLPDSRGEFVRGWDHGRGTDPLRTLGSFQSDLTKAHNHTASSNSTGAHSHNYTRYSFFRGGESNPEGEWAGTSTQSTSASGNHSHSITVNSSSGSETRPRNTSRMMIIKE